MAGKWETLTNQPMFGGAVMHLVTDGRVMVQGYWSKHWHALKPDVHGSYVNGTWETLAPMSLDREYYASGVLKDGRVIVVGGIKPGGPIDQGEIYEPVTDTWSAIPSPPMKPSSSGCCVLPDGRFMVADYYGGGCAIYDPVTDAWSAAPISDGDSWVLLPDNTIVTLRSDQQPEKYIISSNTWKNEGTLPVKPVPPPEGSTGMLTYDGHVIFFAGDDKSSGVGKTVVYTPPAIPTGTGTWIAGPDIPKEGGGKTVVDWPITLLPNGKVLFMAGPEFGPFPSNYFFEYDPPSNTIAVAPSPPNTTWHSYFPKMILLPSGQVLFQPGMDGPLELRCYTPDGMPLDAWRPTISSVTPANINQYYLLQGTQLNGLSQANNNLPFNYAATNFPIVCLKDDLSQVFYCRTYHFSTMGVATGASTQSVRFVVPDTVPSGEYNLYVIANGISSLPAVLSHFQFKRPKPMIVDGGKLPFEYLGKIIYEGDPWRTGKAAVEGTPWDPQWTTDPEIKELKTKIKGLQNSISRLESLIKTKDLPPVGKEIAEQASRNKRASKKSPRKKSKPKNK